MSNPDNFGMPPPSIRFVSHAGMESGICPSCKRVGEAGKFCYNCCFDQGMAIGKCLRCGDCGNLGHTCDVCGGANYQEEVE